MTEPLSAGEYAVGLVLLALVAGCCAGAAELVVRRRLGHLRGSARAAALALLAVAGVLAAHLLPLLAGVMTRLTVLVTAAALLGAALAVRPVAARPEHERPAGAATTVLSWILAAAGLVLAVGYAVAFLRDQGAVRVTGIDYLGFHLPLAVGFLQDGSLWELTQFLPDQAHATYPQHGDVLFAAALLPWDSDAFVRYVDPVLLAVAAVGLYGCARELGAPATASILATLCVVALGPVVEPALADTLTDPLFLAGFACGTLFLLRHVRTRRSADLVLAGLGLGIALGTKWYGLTDVPVMVLFWVAALLLARRPRAEIARAAGVLVAVIAAAGGVWMLRNLILTGNPVYQLRVAPFGITIFDAPFDEVRARVGFSIAHYATDPDILREYVFPVWREDFGAAGALLALAVPVALVLARSAADRRVPLLAVAAILLGIAYLVTPYSALGVEGEPTLVTANTRYGVPALLVAAPLLAWAAGRSGRLRPLAEAAMVAVVFLGLREHLPTGFAAAAATGALLGAVAAGAWWAAQRRLWPVLAGAALLAAVAVAGLGYDRQRDLAASAYRDPDPVLQFVVDRAPSGTRIGLTGSYIARGLQPAGVLFGPRLDNHVEYVGPFVDDLLRRYRRPERFRAALARGRYDLLVAGTGFPPRPHPSEEVWAKAAGWEEIARSARFILLAPPRSTAARNAR